MSDTLVPPSVTVMGTAETLLVSSPSAMVLSESASTRKYQSPGAVAAGMVTARPIPGSRISPGARSSSNSTVVYMWTSEPSSVWSADKYRLAR